jgi:zinc protease
VKGVLIPAALMLAACGAQLPLPPPPPSPAPVASWPPLSAPPPPPRQTPDASFRDNMPPPGPPVVWSAPKVESWSLASGVRVLFVERHDLPIVSVRVVSTLGAGDLSGLRPGMAAFMGSMLEQGAGKRSALEINDDFEALGAVHGAWCDWDSAGARIKVLTSKLAPALDMLADVVLRPTFPQEELDRVRKRWLASIQTEKNSPATEEQNAIAAAVYGRAHPYGHSIRGVAADIEPLTRADLLRTYGLVFTPKSTAIVVAGDVTRDGLSSLLEARFGTWKGRPTPRMPVPPAPAAPRTAGRVVLVDVPGAAQSQTYIVQPGAPFVTKDRIPLQVMNLILGGMFSSRINLELREAKAYTYGARSRFSMRHGAGPFAAGGAIFSDHTADAARELLAQVARMRDEPVSADELRDAKEQARLALPARFESVDDVAGAVQDLAVYDLPLDEYATRAARIDAVTAADVQRVAKAWLHPPALRIVVAGDRAKIEKDLGAIGTVEVRDAYGDPVK